MFGSGGMAHSHLEAFMAVRPIKRVQVYSPTRANREAFAEDMAEKFDIEVISCETTEDAVRGADILSTNTSSVSPTVFPSMLEPGMHLTQVMGEFHRDVIPLIDVAVGGDPPSQVVQGVGLDDSGGLHHLPVGQPRGAGDCDGLRAAAATHCTYGGKKEQETKARVVPLVDLIGGTAKGRLNDAEISASGGVKEGGGKQGLQFVTTASLVFDEVKRLGLGHQVPTDWFLQDIRN